MYEQREATSCGFGGISARNTLDIGGEYRNRTGLHGFAIQRESLVVSKGCVSNTPQTNQERNEKVSNAKNGVETKESLADRAGSNEAVSQDTNVACASLYHVSDIPFNIFPCGPDKKPLVKGWQEAATRDPETIARWQSKGVAAWGIPTGARNDLFVVDLDVDKETGELVGEQVFRRAGFGQLLSKVNVSTPTGGSHIYFRHFEGARNTTGKIGPKVDTRGEGGYVIALGSRTNGGVYRGSFPELGHVPNSMRVMLQTPQHAPRANQRPSTAPRGEVEELLSFISPDLPYNSWVTVLMGLHTKYSGSSEGLAIADQWSAGSSKHKPGEVAAKWRSFQGAGVNWPTVPAMARQNGANLSEIARRWMQ